ncbi:sugar ABC transporter substrate-binding protein [Conexibacter sp. CPCC 206217]|uniref:sugar ABC transporter substrate-binding protein n=1 Tax=Conexibacter sp. CPCC 206217 TaxID=3064574 RepID=UPI00271A345E|nr:sugar ABC transporter substrate-binding protein [Conexibacter sp. CPCC 206217]MDO8212243.1 sugar ABC transporter substrate-binding protein [Conexibacter sp. CPCC 206217]
MTKRGRTSWWLAAVAAVGVLALAGCGDSESTGGSGGSGGGGDGASVDVGTQKISVSGQPRVAYFVYGSGNAYGAAGVAAAKAAAARNDLELTVYDGAFDPQKQFNQLQTAVQSGRFNAFSLGPIDANLVCTLASRQAPAKKIVVGVVNQPLCGRYIQPTDAGLWQPGTLNYASGYFTRRRLLQWLQAVADKYPGPQKVGLITGLAVDSLSKLVDLDVKEIQRDHPDFDVVGELRTDYTTTKGYSAAQNLLQSNPDLTLIVSDYSDLTVGAAKAIEQAGKSGSVALADFGGSRQVAELVRRGVVGLTAPTYPKTEVEDSIEALVAAFRGTTPERVTLPPFKVYTSDDIDQYEPQF